MKLLFTCWRCPTKPDGLPISGRIHAELRDDGIYEISCSEGHENLVRVGNEKYEFLFDMAAMAYVDGYGREAVATFAATLERFYEWAIRLLLLGVGVEPTAVDSAWRRVAKQSERQIGAYIFLHLIVFKGPPQLLENSEVGFRNRVIHEGYIPPASEVADFGDRVMQIILDGQDRLRAWAGGLENLPKLTEMTKSSHSKYGLEAVSTQSRPTILNRSGRHGLDRHDTFSEALDVTRELKQMYGP